MQRPITPALLWVLVFYGLSSAQAPIYNPGWYLAGRPYVKLAVTEDGVYRLDASDLSGAGVDLMAVDPATFRLMENGREIPVWYEGPGPGVEPTDYLLFVGRRNSGDDEAWVYNYDDSLRSSAYRSLYSDTTTYFLTWGGDPGLRYQRRANDAVSGPTVARVLVEDRLETDNSYYFGEPLDSGNPLYTAGEGYYMTLMSHGQAGVLRTTYNIAFTNLTRFEEDTVRIDVKLQGGTRVTHLGFIDIRYLDPGTNSLTETAFDSVRWLNYESALLSAKLPQTWVPGSGNMRLRVGSDNTIGALPNNMYVDYVAYSYARTLNAAPGPFHFVSESAGPTTFQLSGPAETNAIVLRPGTRARFDVAGNGMFGDDSEPGAAYWLVSPDQTLRPAVSLDQPSNLATTSIDANYVIISAPGLLESAHELADYRSSPQGGGYRVLVVDVADVFDQFDYGRPTPVAIRRFVDRMNSWQGHPKYVTLWGDALYPDAKRVRFSWEVPSFGNASSDGWFAMQAGGNLSDYVERRAVGRITVRSDDAGAAFVEKIRRYESRPPAAWQKRAIMMSGGATESQQLSLTNHTQRWGGEIAEPPFGGDVTFFHKTSLAALDPTFLDSVDAAIREGSGWLAFFGHSAADTWEIVTEPPTMFANSQTLPIVVSLGCFTGAYARGDGSSFDQPPFAELLVTESENGAIAHYGGSTSSAIGVASQIANPFYDIVFLQGQRILGDAIIDGKQQYLGSSPTGIAIETVLQYNLIGDPATHMALPSAPDFHLEAHSVAVTPAAPVSGIDSTMTVTVSVENRGLVPPDSLTVEIVRTSPDGTPSTQSSRLPAFSLLHEVRFRFPLRESDVGQNRLQVRVDPDNEFAETSEDDNAVDLSQLVFASGVVQLFPPEMGLVVSRSPGLRYGKASSAEDVLTVVAQLDTSDSFDSDALVGETLEARALSKWIPPSALINGSTYYWRMAVEEGGEPKFRSRTFTVRDDLPFNGWFQQGGQFQANEFGPSLSFSDSAWRMHEFNVDIRVRSAQFKADASNTIIVGGFEHETLEVGFSAVIVSVEGLFKASDSFVPYPNVYNRDEVAERERMREFLAGAEPHEFVFVNSRFIRLAPGAVDLPEETKEFFRDLGSTQIDSVDLNDLWNFGVRIGDDSPLIDEWQDRDPDVGPHILWSDLSIPVRFASGDAQSPPIGPAVAWHEFQMAGSVNNGRSSIKAFVLSMDGDTLGSTALQEPGGSARIDLSPSGLNIDAAQHPFLRLEAVLTDSTRLDTPQLTGWYVGYDPISEMAIDAPAFRAPIDTLTEGDPLHVSVSVINGGPSPIDSVFVSYTTTDASNRSELGAVDTLLAVAADATVESSASIGTLKKVGLNRIAVTAEQRRGPEPAGFNNTAIGTFRVLGDDTPPVFNLTVDGATYPNDPRVINTTDDPSLPFFAANPLFEIVVSDDNEFLSLSDTTVISLMLDNARISYAREDVQFVPASTPGDEAKLIFTPDFSGQDTTHTLKAWAQDASGNSDPTKESPYTLSFRVQDAAEIENLYPYPNPMHRFTTFMFRLRGADPSRVEDLRIRVYTISGRPVREFDLVKDPGLLEDGGLRIGWNRLVWDGRDEDGDLLATGVYLYKVFLRAEGREVSVNNDTGIEKIAIIR